MDKDTVLVIEDDPMSMKLIRKILQINDNYAVLEAENADDGIEMACKYHPGIILMDILMPGMNGIEATKRLKEDQQTKDIPVLFISALDETDDKVKAFQSGGVDYITKPFQFEEVFARIKTHLTLRNMNAQLEEKNIRLQSINEELQGALEEIKTLKGILPICGNCKKIRDDKGYWNQIESFIRDHSEAEFSHSICPECVRALYPDSNSHEN